MADIVIYDVVPRAGVIDLGKQVEGLVTRVVLPNIRRGAGAVQLVHQRSDDQKPYPVPVTEDGDTVYWVVTRSDTAFPGRGQAELQWLGENGAVAKSVTYQTNTTRSMAEPGPEPDEPLKPYTQAVARDAQAARDAAVNATEAARSAEASAGQAGLSAATAVEAAKNAEAIVGQAGQSAQSAQAAALAAAQNAAAAKTAEAGAKQAQTGAAAARTEAQTAKTAAEKAAQEAKAAQTGAVEAKTGAETAQAKAEEAAQEAQKAAETAVLYTEQHLTDAQQEQARSNINAADKARQNVLVGTETGNPIAVDDAFSAPLCGLTVYGKSTQDGTPTPDAPVPIVSAGDGGSVMVTLSDGNGKTQTLTLPTTNGLPGIPAAYGGNYTDQNGQQWVCDEVDPKKGVYVQRIGKRTITPKDIFAKSGLSTDDVNYFALNNFSVHVGQTGKKNVLMSNYFVAGTNQFFKETGKIFLGGVSGDKIYFSVDAQKYPDAETFKQWAVENGLMFLYQLTDMVETHLIAGGLAAYKALTAYAPDSVVQASDGAGVKLEYQRDVNIAIKKLEDAIASMTAT